MSSAGHMRALRWQLDMLHPQRLSPASKDLLVLVLHPLSHYCRQNRQFDTLHLSSYALISGLAQELYPWIRLLLPPLLELESD